MCLLYYSMFAVNKMILMKWPFLNNTEHNTTMVVNFVYAALESNLGMYPY